MQRAGAGRGQDHSMMIASIIEHDDDATASRSIAQQLREEALERCGIEHLADPAHEVFLPPQLSGISWNDSGTLFAEPKAHAAE